MSLRWAATLVSLPIERLWAQRRGAFLRGRYFACRKCHDLRYRTQRENRTDRALRVCFDIRERLGGSRSLAEEFPEKPNGMHWRTYLRQIDSDEDYRLPYRPEILPSIPQQLKHGYV